MVFQVTFSLADFIEGKGYDQSFLLDVSKKEAEKLKRLQGRETRFGRIERVTIKPYQPRSFSSVAALLQDKNFRATTGLDGNRVPSPEQLLKSIQQDPSPSRPYKSSEQLSREINETLDKDTKRKR